MMDPLSIILGFCLGVSTTSAALTIWLFKEVKEVLREVKSGGAVVAVNGAVNVDRSNWSKEAVKVYKLDNAVNVGPVNVDRDAPLNTLDALQHFPSPRAGQSPLSIQSPHSVQSAQLMQSAQAVQAGQVAQAGPSSRPLQAGPVPSTALPLARPTASSSTSFTMTPVASMEAKGEKGEGVSRGGARVWDSEALKAEILRLRGQGLSTREIGRRLGVSHNLVVYYLKKMS